MVVLAMPDGLWLEQGVVTDVVRQWVWLYPAIESLHLLGLALLVGAIALFDLRLLGFSHPLRITDLAQHLLPWADVGFAIAAITGGLLFAADVTPRAANPAYRIKLLLIALAGVNTALFQFRYRSVRLWNRGVMVPMGVQAIAVTSLLLWIAVIICDRLIADVCYQVATDAKA